ncbi:MAG: LysM peptidoglycan-binding domain-containing protein [Gammaproteobacteria bacterium]|nr:LysM peptidoglycan-binding domain-containing protein [Gammaproteobacteria bacterium]
MRNLIFTNRLSNTVLRVLPLAILLAFPAFNAHAVPKVERHELKCDDTFPCPPEIRRRVDFWIMVFRAWNTNQVIFHDTQRPERVYSVKRTKATCRRRGAARSIEVERERIRGRLRGIAAKLDKKTKKWSREEKALLALFPDGSAKTIRTAAKNIRCQQGNRDRFIEALKRYGKYRNHIIEVLRDHDLSEDIQYLPFVESAYNPKAYSRVGAAGLWQIMPRTARTLGLQLNATIDERFDPEAATWGAARYLSRSTATLTKFANKKNRNVTQGQINPFVITSYNYGVAGMSRAINQIGPDYVKVLDKYRSRAFRTAVKNFYSSFLAARYVAKNADRYFGSVAQSSPFRYSAVALKRPTSVQRITKVFGVPAAKLKALNPALTRFVWNGWRLIPEGYTLKLPHHKDDWFERVAKLNSLPAEQPQLSGQQYVVQRGDTACRIARAFDVRCRDLIELNRLGRRALIRVGQKLDIPGQQRKQPKLVVAKAEAVNLVPPAAGGKSSSPPAAKRTDAAPSDQLQEVTPQPFKNTFKNTPPTALKQPPPLAPTGAGGTVSAVLAPLVADVDGQIAVETRKGRRMYLVKVLPEETLGHYADWLGLGFSTQIRKLNGLKRGRQLRIGQKLRLPIENDDQRRDFEGKRAEYHRTLVDEFREHYDVAGVDTYTLKKGDSLWKLAREYELPYWVLTRYNPNVSGLNVGDAIRIPTVRARTPQEEPPMTDKG